MPACDLPRPSGSARVMRQTTGRRRGLSPNGACETRQIRGGTALDGCRGKQIAERREFLVAREPARGLHVGGDLLGLGRARDHRATTGRARAARRSRRRPASRRARRRSARAPRSASNWAAVAISVAPGQPRAAGAGLAAAVLAGQQPRGEREERDEAESEPLARGQHLALGLADEQAVLVLDRGEPGQAVLARDRVGLVELRGAEVRGADRADLARGTSSCSVSSVSAIGVTPSGSWYQ